MADAPRLAAAEIALYERSLGLRLPFRYGAATLTHARQAFVRVRIRLEGGGESWGMAAELLAPKWFDKNPALSDEQNYHQLRSALAIARRNYTAAGPATAFGLYRACYREQIDQAARDGLGPLAAGFGPALIDKAVLDALCRHHGLSVFAAMAGNAAGIENSDLTPDLGDFDVDRFVRTLAPQDTIAARHTVGMLDPIAGEGGLNDGLPETLEEIVETYGHRYFKLKVGGDPATDIARLSEIAAVLDRIDGPYRATIDGNEQYGDTQAVQALLAAIGATPALGRLRRSILFIEQPLDRVHTLATDIADLGGDMAMIIDEADGTLDAFPCARSLGYRGVSSKSCKGLYKSILNAARCRRWNGGAREGRFFMSAEDLMTQAGLGVQQDTALAALIGCTHVERNGHHYVDGMSGVPEEEQRAFLAAHPDLYRRSGDAVRLVIRDGSLSLSSLDCPGFAADAEPDWAAMDDMPLPS